VVHIILIISKRTWNEHLHGARAIPEQELDLSELFPNLLLDSTFTFTFFISHLNVGKVDACPKILLHVCHSP
jgi:hypothetical protein